ncbi:MAG TPA: lipid A biosynthesis lauroyl acyltransferase [Candidatus Megaira endosymbiont of Stentor roeselii]|nr:lipid A biosynthesis lauroyl acyltransferase [Candidatus Megaera endosymbiont of Stentor roeselii]
MKNYSKKIKHFIEYVFLKMFIKTMKIIGFKNSVAFCSWTARFLGPYMRVTKIAERNLDKVFGEELDIKKIIPQIWDNFGKYIGEFPFINELSDQEMKSMFTMEGIENVKSYQQTKKPFLLFLAHQANWDFVIRHITDIYPKFAIIYRKANNSYVDREILRTRSKNPNVLMIAKGPTGAKGLVRAIKNGYSIAMLVDQKMNDGIEVPFFGRPAMTANAIAKLSLQYNYPIIPCQLIRIKESNFKAILHPEIKYQPTGSKENDVYNIILLINQTLEKWIKENPSQWFWFHNRWEKIKI